MALHRPYLRKSVIQEVKDNAPKNEKGQFLDANTSKPIEGKINIGHRYGHEYWREAEKAEKEGLTQKEFNDRMNNPKMLQIEDEHSNKSHEFEMPKNEEPNDAKTNNDADKGGKPAMDKNEFLESLKVDKATQQRMDEVMREHAKNNKNATPRSKSDDGGRERSDSKYGRESGLKHGGEEGGKASPSASSHSNGGKAVSSGQSSGAASSGGGHGTGSSGSGGPGIGGGHGTGGSGGQGGGGHGSSGGSGGHGGH